MFGKRLGSRGDPRCPRGFPQLGPWAEKKRVPDLALPHYHTKGYLEYHHRILIRSRMEIETEIFIRVMDCVPKVKLKSRRRENMRKEVRTVRGLSSH